MELTRREFVLTASLASTGLSASAPFPSSSRPADRVGKFRKAILDSLLPKSLPLHDRFQLAVDLGFEGVEAAAPDDDASVEAIGTASRRAGIPIHSVMNGAGNWAFSLSSEKPDVAEKGLQSLCRSIRVAAAWKADNVLLVPAQVTPAVRYQEAWRRSQEMIRRALPLARELGVCITIENVGNRFLLSPLEFARYIDELADPLLQAYFDVGNCVILWGYPQDWLATLGKRVRKIHLKDCKFADKKFVPLGDGDVDWPAVVRAMNEIGYQGFVTAEPNYSSPELKRGDREALADLARRMDEVMQAT